MDIIKTLLEDAGERLVVVKRLVALPRLALLHPRRNILRRFDDLVELGERIFHVAANRNMRWLVLVQLRGIDIHMHDLAVLAELFHLAGDAIVEPHAEGN